MGANEWLELGDTALRHLNSLKRLQRLHLTSVAKAIEIALKDNIKIIFWGEPEQAKEHDITGLTMSQVCRVLRPGCAEQAI